MSFQLQQENSGIATLLMDVPEQKLNTFSPEQLEELSASLDSLPKETKALVLRSGKPESFIAGADLHSFTPTFDSEEETRRLINLGHSTFNQLAALPFPTIAVIHGVCLGGGLECALACDYRIVTDHPKTLLGLPEVTLGIIPGWGGTQRLPRLIGLQAALKMILPGQPVGARKACKLGLADAILPYEFLDEQLPGKIESCLRKKPKTADSWIEKLPYLDKFICSQAKKQVLAKTRGLLPAPLVALELIEKTWKLPIHQGLKQEARTFVKNMGSEFKPGLLPIGIKWIFTGEQVRDERRVQPQKGLARREAKKMPHVKRSFFSIGSKPGFQGARHLINLFFQREALKKERWTEHEGRPVHYGAVVGAGTMGAGIACLFGQKQLSIRMKDVDWDRVRKGIQEIEKIFNTLVKIKKRKNCQAKRQMVLVGGCVDYSGFKRAEVVIEAATENLEAKKSLLREIESEVSTSCLIGSNTSSLNLEELAKMFKHPERFLGIHFFNPANRMPLVEIAPTTLTSEESVSSAVAIVRQLGKIPIVVKPCPGLLVNRIFAAGFVKALHLLNAGASIESLEKAMLDYGFPMGPFTLSDHIGNDINASVLKTFAAAYGERMEAPKFFDSLVEKGWLGKKSGKGFFFYRGKNQSPNRGIQKLLKKRSGPSPVSPLIDPIFQAMKTEATLCLEEGIIKNPEHLHLALVLGIGYPPFQPALI